MHRTNEITPPPALVQQCLHALGFLIIFTWTLYACLGKYSGAHHGLMLAPWVLAILDRKQSMSTWPSVLAQHRLTIISTAIMAAWIILGATVHSSERFQRIEMAMLWLTWIPIAISLSSKNKAQYWRLHSFKAGAWVALLVFGLLVLKNHYLKGVDRPTVYMGNVLLGPCTLALGCLVASIILTTEKSSLRRSIELAFVALTVAVITVTSGAKISILALFMVTMGLLLAVFQGYRLCIVGGVSLMSSILFFLQSDRWIELFHQIGLYTTTTHKTSFGARWDTYSWGISHLQKIPPFGFDAKTLDIWFNQRYLEYNIPPEEIYVLYHMHNDFLQVIYSYGWVVGIAFLFLLAGFVRELKTRAAQVKDTASWAAYLPVGSISALIMLGLVDTVSYWPKVLLLVQLILGGCAAVTARQARTCASVPAPSTRYA